MSDDVMQDGIQTAAKVVKLATSDWRKLALASVAMLLTVIFVVYNLLTFIARAEITRLDLQDHTMSAQIDAMDQRLKRTEDMQADLAVLRNDVGWIRRELERKPAEKREEAH